MLQKALENGVRIYTNIILKNAFLTVAVLGFITVLLLQSALTFEQNMTRDIEVYLPEGEESTDILIEVREDWATDLIIVYIETGNAKDPDIFDDTVASFFKIVFNLLISSRKIRRQQPNLFNIAIGGKCRGHRMRPNANSETRAVNNFPFKLVSSFSFANLINLWSSWNTFIK